MDIVDIKKGFGFFFSAAGGGGPGGHRWGSKESERDAMECL